ncbi:MAG TPA: glucokinase [Stellaceae bacterium]|nr:glucokinase [Stellaceae bacterium]
MAGHILAGDVGGTKTHLGLFKHAAGQIEMIRDRRYATAQFPSLEAACAEFLALDKDAAIDAACFGVRGPVIDGRARATNVPWEMSRVSLARALNGVPVRLINDLGATAYGVIHLKPAEVAVLNRAENPPEHGNIAVIAAGTGLGESALVWDEANYHAVASEGGHSDFAPQGAEQIELLRFIEEKFGHASYERVLSGPGLENIYRFVRAHGAAPEPAWLTEQLATSDRAAAISEAALSGRDSACVHALAIFCEIYGAEAANLALKVLALGGVYLAGGIAPKILPLLQRDAFMKGFLSKGRLNEILKQVEVRVALNPAAAMLGAAHCAAAML